MNKLKKYKLIKKYPGSGGLGIIISTEVWPDRWPEYWEEIKDEPILITEDGKELFEGDEFWSVDKRDWKLRKEKAASKAGDCYFWNFSSKELAEKWLEENKPKWSDVDMKAFARDWEDCNDLDGAISVGQFFDQWKEKRDNYE